MQQIQLYGTGSATGSAVAQVVIPSAVSLAGICYSVLIQSKTDAAQLHIEVSKIPTSQIRTNGSRDPFFTYAVGGNFVTSGLAQPNSGTFVPLNVKCRQGEIIYLHAFVSGTITYYFTGILYFPG